ncbi:hypothetical protein C0991_008618, partial [Blastosporella zonata]
MFNDLRKRHINLGGSTSSVSHSALLSSTRAAREERLALQRKHDSAIRIQAWWRGVREARSVRREMRGWLDNGQGLRALRCLVLIGGRDQEALGAWSATVVSGGDDALFALPRQLEHRTSWLILIKQTALLLLRSIAKFPSNPRSIPHLQILVALMTSSTTASALGDFGSYASDQITMYLFSRDLYPLLSQAIASIPPTARASPALPHLASLTTLPLSTPKALTALLRHILTIPLLPNRIPPSALTHLSAHIPFSQLARVDYASILEGTTAEEKVNLLANLQVFVPPRYQLLDPAACGVYFALLTGLVNALPVQVLNPKKAKPQTAAAAAAPTNYDSSDSDDDTHRTR